MGFPIAGPALLISGLLMTSCGGGNAASGLTQPPRYEPKDQTKCGVEKSMAKPLIVEWPSADRGELEAQAHNHGVVVVRYQGCEMQVLDGCTAPVRYGYSPITRKTDHVAMRDADDLYANIPVGAARFEAKLQKSGQLDVDMTLVGRFEAERRAVRLDELQGACDGATHVVSAITVGAFTFTAGADATVGGGATVAGAGGGAQSSSARETLNADGDEGACARATLDDKGPPQECGALIRIEVVPLGAAATPTASSGAAPPAPTQPPPPMKLRDLEQLATSTNPDDRARARALLDADVFGGHLTFDDPRLVQEARVLGNLCGVQQDKACLDAVSRLRSRLGFVFDGEVEAFFVPVSWSFMIDGSIQFSKAFDSKSLPATPYQVPIFSGFVPPGTHTASATCTFRSPGRQYTFNMAAQHAFAVVPGHNVDLQLRLYEPPEAIHGPVTKRLHVAWIERSDGQETQSTSATDYVQTNVDPSAPAERAP